MTTAEVSSIFDELTVANREAAVQYILYLRDTQKGRTGKKRPARRIGTGEGIIVAPDDLDKHNDEVAELFSA